MEPPEHGGEGGVRAGEPSGGRGGVNDVDAAGRGGSTQPDGGVAGAPSEPEAGAGGVSVEPPNEGGAAGAGGAPEPPLTGLFVAVDGSDAASGTLEAPFATLAHAVSVAHAGDRIVLLDGEHIVEVMPGALTLPAGVELQALHTGASTLKADGNTDLLGLTGKNRITGVVFDGFQTALALSQSAELMLIDASFVRCGNVCISAAGTSTLNASAAVGALLGNGTGKFLVASDQSQVRIDGGVLKNYSRFTLSEDAVIEASGSAEVELSNLSIEDGVAQAISVRQTASVATKHVTLATLGRYVIWMNGDASLTLTDSDVSIKPAAQVRGACILQTMDDKGSIWLERTKVHACESGIYGWIPNELTLVDTDIFDQKVFGIDGLGGAGGYVEMTRSKLYDNGHLSLRLGPSTANIDVRVRDSELRAPDSMNLSDGAVEVQATATSLVDFGTLAEPGGNTIVGKNPQSPGLRLHSSLGGTVHAVGNTWVAGQQGADAAGQYAVLTGNLLEIGGPAATGINYGVTNAGSLLRLAEKAP